MDERTKQRLAEYVASLDEDELDSLLGSLEHAESLMRRPNGERKTKMWNQGNGNGNGQGNGYGQPQYGQQQQYQGEQDVYGRLNNTREVGGARFPFMEGSGRYALATLEEFMHSSDGPSARALFKVIDSKVHPIGSFVVKIWKLVKPPYKPGMTTDADQFADFCRKLKGAPQGYPIGNDIRVLMKERPNEQLARGTVIDATAVPNKKNTWMNIYWNAVPQTPQDIAQMRQRLEAEGIPSTNPNQQGTQGGQYQGAPHPSQMQGQYPAQQAQAQQPQGYGQPQYTQAQMPPQQQYAQQQHVQQGYGQQPAPQGQPPQGGYLANVPTNNGGQGNGGNGAW